jgi:hypothetical protein
LLLQAAIIHKNDNPMDSIHFMDAKIIKEHEFH